MRTYLPTPAAPGLAPVDRPLGKTHSVIRLGHGRCIEVRRGWIDSAEHIGLGDYQDGRFTNGILIPRHGLEPLSEAFLDVTRFLGLDTNPSPGQERLF